MNTTKSRFLEFTNASIASAFNKLTNEDVVTLINYPYIFSYKGKQDFRIGL